MGDRYLAQVFSKGKRISDDAIEDLILSLKQNESIFWNDQYKNYPAKSPKHWLQYRNKQLLSFFQSPEHLVYYDADVLLICRNSSWDRDHFGFGMAMISLFSSDNVDPKAANEVVTGCLNQLAAMGVKFVSARICGNSVTAIHVLENAGFRYYETLLSPVVLLNKRKPGINSSIRLMTENDLPVVLEIAGENQFVKSHYHLDRRFETAAVNRMHEKWAQTSWLDGEPASVVEANGTVAGVFVFKLDTVLSDALGLKYGRMRSLALDKSVRGRGLGQALFSGTIDLMQGMGVEVIDSRYSTKNHISAKLHNANGFSSLHEEITLHLWLDK